MRALEEQNVLALESENVFRNPLADNPGIGADQEESESSEKAFSYTTAQKEAIQTVWNGLKAGQRTWLIHGVTGSGKTDVYMEMDQTNGVGRPTGNRSDSGDRADLSDGDAVLSSVR